MAPSKDEKRSPQTSPPSTASSGKQSAHSTRSSSSDISLDNNNNGQGDKRKPRISTLEDGKGMGDSPARRKNAFGSPDGGSVSRLNLKHVSVPGSSLSLHSVSTTRTGRSTSQSMVTQGNQFWAKLKPEMDLNFVKPLDDRYECALCQQVLRYPVQMECGHHCCNSCMVDVLRIEPRCPIDQSRIDKGQLLNDRPLQKEIETLFIRCSNVSCGCSWSGYLKELASHMDRCDYTIISCPNDCAADFERRFLSQHLDEDCPRRMSPCDYCNKTAPLDEMQQHYINCTKFVVTCPNKCGDDLARESLPSHMELECPEQPILCPFYDSGCNFKAKRKELKLHICKSPDIHLDMMAKSLTTCADALAIHDSILERQADRLNTVENQVSIMNKINGYQLIWKIDDFKTKFEDAVLGDTKAIQSPVFAVFRHGYNMQLSACLNGDGKAEGKYMSLYACIVKGDYDSLLPWPYKMNMTVTLLDQCKDPSARRDHVLQLQPNPCKENLVFLKKPTMDKNPYFGFVKFIELNALKSMDFIRNNAIFIKVHAGYDQLKSL